MEKETENVYTRISHYLSDRKKIAILYLISCAIFIALFFFIEVAINKKDLSIVFFNRDIFTGLILTTSIFGVVHSTFSLKNKKEEDYTYHHLKIEKNKETFDAYKKFRIRFYSLVILIIITVLIPYSLFILKTPLGFYLFSKYNTLYMGILFGGAIVCGSLFGIFFMNSKNKQFLKLELQYLHIGESEPSNQPVIIEKEKNSGFENLIFSKEKNSKKPKVKMEEQVSFFHVLPLFIGIILIIFSAYTFFRNKMSNNPDQTYLFFCGILFFSGLYYAYKGFKAYQKIKK